MTEDLGKIKNKSLEKAVRVLNCFIEKQPLGITEISEKLGLYKSNVYDILSTLTALEFAVKDEESNKYYLGIGDYVMTSLYGTGNFVTTGFATNCNYGYQWPREAHTMSPMGQGYLCKDGKYIYMFVNNYDGAWPTFCKAFDLPEDVRNNPRFNNKVETTKIENRSELVDIVTAQAKKKNAQEILDVLVEGDVPSCILNQYKDRFEGEWLEQSLANGWLSPHTYESGKTVYLAQMPIYFESQGVHDMYERHRGVGEDNEALFKEFG